MGNSEWGGYEYPAGSLVPSATQLLNLARDIDQPVRFATESARDLAKTAYLGVPGRVAADAVGLRCYVTSRAGYCTWNGTSWIWDATNVLLPGGTSGLTATMPALTPGSTGLIGSITANLVGQRAIRVEFSAVGFRSVTSAAPIYGRIDFLGTGLGFVSGKTVPFTVPNAPSGALDVADVGLSFDKTAKMTGTVTIEAWITFIAGDTKPYVKQAAITAWDLGPTD